MPALLGTKMGVLAMVGRGVLVGITHTSKDYTSSSL